MKHSYSLNSLVRFHLSDVLATPTLLAFANLLSVPSPFVNLFAQPPFALLIVTAGAIEWELVAPLYTKSTGDPWDGLAYLLGLAVYLLAARGFISSYVDNWLWRSKNGSTT